MTLEELGTKQIGILGLGVNNYEMVLFLLRQGISLTIRDQKVSVQEEFIRRYPDLASLVKWEIKKDILDNLTNFTIIFRSPAIPYLSAKLQRVLSKKVIIYSQTKLFFDLCPARILGISGTKGKSTTATLLFDILNKGYLDGKTYLAGNIGVDPFTFLGKLKSNDLVVLELSSFQLQDLEKSPYLAILLNITPDHLNHHRDFLEYFQAKTQLIAHQTQSDIAILNTEAKEMQLLLSQTLATTYAYSKFKAQKQSAWIVQDSARKILFIQIGDQLDSFHLDGLKLLGEHNLDNIIAAVLASYLLGVSVAIIAKIVRNFSGLEHRLTYLGTYEDVDFYDDSIATTPEACLMALQVFEDRRIHLLAGGKDKGQKYEKLAREIINRCISVSLLPGAATGRLQKELRKAQTKNTACLILSKAQNPVMSTILSGIKPHLKARDIVLLAPAAASDVPFSDYKARGLSFAAAMRDRYQQK